jgi:hypothetical protein
MKPAEGPTFWGGSERAGSRGAADADSVCQSYVKTNKSDYIDAEAIAEAVERPRMRFVPIKSDDRICSPCMGTGALGDASHRSHQPDSCLAARTISGD